MTRRSASVCLLSVLGLLGMMPVEGGGVVQLPITPVYQFDDSSEVAFRLEINHGGNSAPGQFGWYNTVTEKFLNGDTVVVPGTNSIEFNQFYNVGGSGLVVSAVILKFLPNALIHFGDPTCTNTRAGSTNCANPPDPSMFPHPSQFSLQYTTAAAFIQYFDQDDNIVGQYSIAITVGVENTINIGSLIAPSLLTNPGRVRLVWDTSSISIKDEYFNTRGGQDYSVWKDTTWQYPVAMRQELTSQLSVYWSIVPEPATWVTMGTGFGLLMLGWTRRRKLG